MKIAQILGETYKDPATLTGIEQMASDAGYVRIGQGVDARVYDRRGPGKRVVKVMPGYKGSSTEDAGKGFQVFYDFCKMNSKNKFLPKFYKTGYTKPTIERVKFVHMEKLDPVNWKRANLWSYRELVNIATDRPDIDTFTQLLGELRDLGDRADWSTLIQDLANPKSRPNMRLFFQTLIKLHKLSQSEQMDFDLHDQNIMQRKNGQLVITDPFHYESD